MRTTIVRLAVVCGLVGVLAGCGGAAGGTSANGAVLSGNAGAPAAGGSVSAAGSGSLDGMSEVDIANKALDRLKAASSVRIQGTVTDGGQENALDITQVKGVGCSGTLSPKGSGSVQIRVIKTQTWMKPDVAFWKAQGLNQAAALKILKGKWLKLSAKSDLKALTQMCDLSAVLGTAMTDIHDGDLEKTGTSTVNGVSALGLKEKSDGAMLFVSTDATPKALELSVPSDKTKLDFTAYDAKLTLTPPPAASTLDGKKFGV